MSSKQPFCKSFCQTTPDDISSAVTEIKKYTLELQAILSAHAVKAQIYTYEPASRGTAILSYPTVEEVKGPDALDMAIKSYGFALKSGGVTVPKKVVGTIEVPLYIMSEILLLTQAANELKELVKYGTPYAIPSRFDRRKFIASLVDDVITSTIYRKIEVVQDVLASKFSWCSNQKAPILLTQDQVYQILDSTNFYPGELCVDFNKRVERFKVNISSYYDCGSELYRLLDVRLHPVQQISLLNSSKRLIFKLSTPLIISRSVNHDLVLGGLNTVDKALNNVSEFPENYGSLTHLGFGIYVKV